MFIYIVLHVYCVCVVCIVFTSDKMADSKASGNDLYHPLLGSGRGVRSMSDDSSFLALYDLGSDEWIIESSW